MKILPYDCIGSRESEFQIAYRAALGALGYTVSVILSIFLMGVVRCNFCLVQYLLIQQVATCFLTCSRPKKQEIASALGSGDGSTKNQIHQQYQDHNQYYRPDHVSRAPRSPAKQGQHQVRVHGVSPFPVKMFVWRHHSSQKAETPPISESVFPFRRTGESRMNHLIPEAVLHGR